MPEIRVPQYRVKPCPKCKNPAFQWSDIALARRICSGPKGCGLVFDVEAREREVVWMRAEAT